MRGKQLKHLQGLTREDFHNECVQHVEPVEHVPPVEEREVTYEAVGSSPPIPLLLLTLYFMTLSSHHSLFQPIETHSSTDNQMGIHAYSFMVHQHTQTATSGLRTCDDLVHIGTASLVAG